MTYYKKGDWNAICAICGFKFKASELCWNTQINDYVCKDDWEVRHPQERLKARKDIQGVPWTRPDTTPIYQNDPYVAPDLTDPISSFYMDYGYTFP